MFPSARLYTSLHRPASTFPEFSTHEVHTSLLNRVPVNRAFRALLPAYPAAWRSLGTVDAEIMIASSSGWAHGLRTTSRTFRVVYCHNPARWLYGAEYLGSGTEALRLAGPLIAALRRWDQRAAASADLYLANSENTRRRISHVYGRDSVVVHPPVDTDRFTPAPRGTRLLVLSRLLPYKRVDLAVAAATAEGLGLDVVGDGPSLSRLKAAAGPTVRFHGALPDADVHALLQSCNAVCLCGEEDFGMVPVEAQAAGKPVVAYAAGGALETVIDGVTGVYFHAATVPAVREAIRRCLTLDTAPERLAAHAAQFSRQAFAENFMTAITAGMAQRRTSVAAPPGQPTPTDQPDLAGRARAS